MRLPSKREWILIAIVPLLFLLAAGIDSGDNATGAGVVEATHSVPTRARSDSSRGVEAAELDLSRLRRKDKAVSPEDLFSRKSWYVAPPPAPPVPVKVAPPPVPKAPPLPFTYLGRYVDSGKPVFFLVTGERILTAKEGDIIEGNYRVDGVVGTTLGLTYLPLNTKQALDIGGAG
jgi:hypothetical protein